MVTQRSIPRLTPPTATLAKLLKELGVPASRVRLVPPPGKATVRDLREASGGEGGLCELIDGTLVEKAMGWFESRLAVVLGRILDAFVLKQRLGIVLGADGITRLLPKKYRSADIAFIHKSRFPGGKRPTEAYPALVPDLAVEILSKGNTKREMAIKLRQFFRAGTKLIWHIDPKTETTAVYTSPTDVQVFAAKQWLVGGEILPGFKVRLSDILAEAWPLVE